MKNRRHVMARLPKKTYRLKPQAKRLIVLGCLGLAAVIIFIVTTGFIFLAPALGSLLSSLPALNEILFNYGRGFISGVMQENLVSLLEPLANNTYTAELKQLITEYFNKLKTNSAIDFRSFQQFIDTIKEVVNDGIVAPAEVETVRRLIPG